jgi:glycerol kinase
VVQDGITERLHWDEELLGTFDIPPSILPKIMSLSEVFTEARIAPVAGVPIAGILGDQQFALVVQTCFKPGDAKNTYGTGCFLVMNTGKISLHRKATRSRSSPTSSAASHLTMP